MVQDNRKTIQKRPGPVALRRTMSSRVIDSFLKWYIKNQIEMEEQNVTTTHAADAGRV